MQCLVWREGFGRPAFPFRVVSRASSSRSIGVWRTHPSPIAHHRTNPGRLCTYVHLRTVACALVRQNRKFPKWCTNRTKLHRCNLDEYTPKILVLFGLIWRSLAQFGPKKLLLFFDIISPASRVPAGIRHVVRIRRTVPTSNVTEPRRFKRPDSVGAARWRERRRGGCA